MKGHFKFKGWTIFPDKICAITDIQYDNNIDGSIQIYKFKILLDGSHTITISYFDDNAEENAKKGRNEFIGLVNKHIFE
jgi:hypothetical protein